MRYWGIVLLGLLISTSSFAQDSLNIFREQEMDMGWDRANHVQFHNGLAYVSTMTTGFRIVAVLSNGEVFETGSFDTPGICYETLIGEDDILYVADGHAGLHVFSVQDYHWPQLLATLPLPGSSQSLTLINDVLYVSCLEGGVQVVDVSDPTEPNLIGEISTVDQSYTTAWHEPYLFIANGEARLQIFEVHDPDNIEYIYTFWSSYPVVDVDFYQDIMYVALAGRQYMIVNMEDVLNPEVRGSVNVAGLHSIHRKGATMEILISQGSEDSGFILHDLSDPSAPVETFQFHIDEWPLTCGTVIPGNRLCAVFDSNFEETHGNFEVYDVSNPQAPELFGAARYNTTPRQINMYDNKLYIITGGEPNFRHWNTMNPYFQSEYPSISFEHIIGFTNLWNLLFFLTDNYLLRLYSAQYSEGLEYTTNDSVEIEIGDASQVAKGFLATEGFNLISTTVYYEDEVPFTQVNRYHCDYYPNLWLDSEIRLPGFPKGLAASEEVVCVAHDLTVSILDMDLEEGESILSEIEFSAELINNEICELMVHDNILNISTMEHGLYRYDITRPDEPGLMFHHPELTGLHSMRLVNDLLYAVTADGGIVILEPFDGEEMVEVAYHWGQNAVRDIHVFDDGSSENAWIYAAEGGQLVIYGGPGMTGITGPSAVELPQELSLSNYPNPFNNSTVIQFVLPSGGNLRLTVFDVLGREVGRLYNSCLNAGKHQLQWNGMDTDGRALPSGMYFLQMETPQETTVRRMILLH